MPLWRVQQLKTYFTKCSIHLRWTLLVPKTDRMDQPEKIMPFGPENKNSQDCHFYHLQKNLWQLIRISKMLSFDASLSLHK